MAKEVIAVQPLGTTAVSNAYVEWAPIIGGTFVALAISLVLLTFGVAVGLASVSPYTSTGTGLKAVGFGSAFWVLLVTLWSVAFGSYLAGRMRHRWADASSDEVKFRDGTHGLLVWAVAVVASGLLAASGVSALGRGVATVAAPAGFEATSVATDALLRASKPGAQPIASPK